MDKTFLLYVVRRLLEAIPLLAGTVVVAFLLIQLAPGDPIQALVGDFPASPEYIEQVTQEFGLDKPWYEQLWAYFANILSGNLGFSFANRRPVTELVLERMINTLILTLSAITFAALVGILLGILASRWPRSWLDTLITTGSLFGYSLPVFWLGQILIVVFAVNLGWLPAQGMRTPGLRLEGWDNVTDTAIYALLPVIALSVRYLGLNARMTRSSMLAVMGSDFIVTARAKGARELQVVVRHGLRNGLLPVITVIGYSYGFALSGSALVETVFGWPGIGRLLFTAIGARDSPVVIGVFLFATGTAILVNLITDLVYGTLDPRIRLR